MTKKRVTNEKSKTDAWMMTARTSTSYEWIFSLLECAFDEQDSSLCLSKEGSKSGSATMTVNWELCCIDFECLWIDRWYQDYWRWIPKSLDKIRVFTWTQFHIWFLNMGVTQLYGGNFLESEQQLRTEIFYYWRFPYGVDEYIKWTRYKGRHSVGRRSVQKVV